MATYRIYLRDHLLMICGRDDFDAEGDDTAIAIAGILADACSDRCGSFEVWQGTRLVSGVLALSPRPRVALSELAGGVAQSVVIDREIAIKDSMFAIASSRRLLKKLEQFGAKKTGTAA